MRFASFSGSVFNVFPTESQSPNEQELVPTQVGMAVCGNDVTNDARDVHEMA